MTLLACIITWLVLPLNLGKKNGSFKCLFAMGGGRGGVSNAQTKSGANIPWFLFIYFVEQEG